MRDYSWLLIIKLIRLKLCPPPVHYRFPWTFCGGAGSRFIFFHKHVSKTSSQKSVKLNLLQGFRWRSTAPIVFFLKGSEPCPPPPRVGVMTHLNQPLPHISDAATEHVDMLPQTCLLKIDGIGNVSLPGTISSFCGNGAGTSHVFTVSVWWWCATVMAFPTSTCWGDYGAVPPFHQVELWLSRFIFLGNGKLKLRRSENRVPASSADFVQSHQTTAMDSC